MIGRRTDSGGLSRRPEVDQRWATTAQPGLLVAREPRGVADQFNLRWPDPSRSERAGEVGVRRRRVRARCRYVDGLRPAVVAQATGPRKGA